MTAYINKIADKAGVQQLPVTHERAVRDDNGTTLESKMQNLEGAMDKAYVASSDNGMGRITLKKNMVSGVNTLTQSMMQATNTIYVIRYDFTLGEDITVPANCVLEFDGGSISGDGANKNTITGSNTYIIAEDTAIFNNGIIISGIWVCPRITSSWFDDITSTNRLQQLINLSSDNVNNHIIVMPGNYSVNDTWAEKTMGCLMLKSNTILEINGIITLEPNPNVRYNIILCDGKEDVIICGSGSVVGDRDTHTGTSEASEWGYCICIRNNSSNVSIRGINISQAWGDDIIIYNSKRIKVENCEIFEGGRQGISISENSENIIVENCYIHDVTRTAPSACIDVESNYANQDVHNVAIRNCILVNNTKQAIQIGGTTGMVIDNISIQNNRIIARVGVSLYEACKAAIIEGNTINAVNEGIVFYGHSENVILRDNIIVSSGYSAISYKYGGFKILNNSINGNIVYDRPDVYNIDDVTISDNNIQGRVELPYCTDAVVKNNVISKLSSVSGSVFCFNSVSCPHDTSFNSEKQYNNTINVILTADNHYIALFKDKAKYIRDNVYNVTGSYKCYAFFMTSVQHSYIEFDDNVFNLDCNGSSQMDPNKIIGKNNRIDRAMFDDIGRISSLMDVSKFLYAKEDGTTSDRPTLKAFEKGKQYFDTTLGKPIYWNGTAWVDATGTPV